jgi:Mg-chelatase subunit ChlI
VVEREGVSVQHPSRFILVGTMNPEEGELRPQLLDRLALHAEIASIFEKGNRVAIMKLNIEFEEDPIGFLHRFEAKQREVMERTTKAKSLLRRVRMPDSLFEAVADLCIALQVDGHRPDIIIVKGAKTLAAFEGREEVAPEDVYRCALLALSHRTRSLGAEAPATIAQITATFDRIVPRGPR